MKISLISPINSGNSAIPGPGVDVVDKTNVHGEYDEKEGNCEQGYVSHINLQVTLQR